MDGCQRSVKLFVLNFYHGDGFLGDFLGHRASGYNGNASVNFNGAFNSLDVVEFHGVIHLHIAIRKILSIARRVGISGSKAMNLCEAISESFTLGFCARG